MHMNYWCMQQWQQHFNMCLTSAKWYQNTQEISKSWAYRICSKTQSTKGITQHENERKFSKKTRSNMHGGSIFQYLAWNWRSVALLQYSSELSPVCFLLYRITSVRHSLLLVIRRMYKEGVLKEMWSERCLVFTRVRNEQQSQQPALWSNYSC